MRRDGPYMTEGIDQRAAAVAVELILDVALHLGSCRHRLRKSFVDVGDVEHQAHRRAPESLRAAIGSVRHLVGEHHDALADLDLGVTDSAAGTWKAHQLDGAKRLFVEVERTRRPANDQIRRDARVTAGNGLDHGIASWGSAEICGATPSVRAARRQRQRRSDPERLDFLKRAISAPLPLRGKSQMLTAPFGLALALLAASSAIADGPL